MSEKNIIVKKIGGFDNTQHGSMEVNGTWMCCFMVCVISLVTSQIIIHKVTVFFEVKFN